MENFVNDFQTLLAAPIDGSATSILVLSATGAPAPNFRIRIGDEYLLVTSKGAGVNWTVQRGIEGSAAVAHAVGAVVTHVLTADSFTQAVSSVATTAGAAAAAAAIAAGIAWSSILSTPTTLAGYGIADAYTKAQSDARYAPIAVPWASITGTPTTLAGYGITDAYTKAQSDARYAPIAVPWASITGTPTTLAGYGITDQVVLQTGSYANPAWITSLAWGKITGTPTTATGYGIASIDNVPIGATTASTGVFSTIGVGTASLSNCIVRISQTHPSASTTPAVIGVDVTLPATATGASNGYFSTLRTAAAAFTVSSLEHFRADSTVLGAGSAITTVYGFRARNTVAVGATSYAFHTDFASNTNTWAFYGSGTAASFFGGPVGIVNSNAGGQFMFTVGANTSLTNASAYGVWTGGTIPATTTTQYNAFNAAPATAASVFTLTALRLFFAQQATAGAGSTITNVYGFYAANAIAVGGTSSTGFFSDINAAAGVRQMNMSGTADCQFAGAIVMNNAPYIASMQTVTYSASMTPAAASGNDHTITATNSTAFTINAPTNPRTGQRITVTIRNTSGGALGTATWNAVFKMTAWTQPANGFSRTVEFRYDGTNWVEVDRTAADVPN